MVEHDLEEGEVLQKAEDQITANEEEKEES